METDFAMKNVLICIATKFIWLFERYGFRITDSLYDSSLGGQGLVEMKNSQLTIRFVSDREKVHVEFSPLEGWPEEEGVTWDLLYRKLTGRDCDTAILTEDSARFLKDHFDAVLKLFSENDSGDLRILFNKLKKERARRLLG